MKRDPTTQALVPDKTKFPHGMKSLADYIHGKGLLLGICKCLLRRTELSP